MRIGLGIVDPGCGANVPWWCIPWLDQSKTCVDAWAAEKACLYGNIPVPVLPTPPGVPPGGYTGPVTSGDSRTVMDDIIAEQVRKDRERLVAQATETSSRTYDACVARQTQANPVGISVLGESLYCTPDGNDTTFDLGKFWIAGVAAGVLALVLVLRR